MAEINQIKGKQQRKHTKKKRAAKRIIGIVKFFDMSKNFGFIVSNSLYVRGKETGKNELCNFHVKGSSLVYPWLLSEGQWVEFTPGENTYGAADNALNVAILECNLETLTKAMVYRGEYAHIQGEDTHSGKEYDASILAHIISKIEKEDPHNAVEIIASAFCNYIHSLPPNEELYCINELLLDETLNQKLIKVLLPLDTLSGATENIDSLHRLKKALIDRLLSRDSISSLYQLPASICLDEYAEPIINLLSRNTAHADDLKSWLSSHLEFASQIKLADEDIATIPLRLILDEVLDGGGMSPISALTASWKHIRNFISEPPTGVDIQRFICRYFAGRSESFVMEHPIVDVLSSALRDKLDGTESKTKVKVCKELLPQFLGYYADKDLAKVTQYIHWSSTDITSFSDKLVDLLNVTIESAPMDVRKFLAVCQEKKIPLGALFTPAHRISDNLCIELFEKTNNSKYLNRIADISSCASWISLQPTEFILSFIKKYRTFITDIEEDKLIPSLGIDIVAKVLKSVVVEEQYQLLHLLPKEMAEDVATKYFKRNRLYTLFIDEKWNELQRQFPYVVFDLEGDRSEIKEFAFHAENNIYSYETEAELPALFSALGGKDIIVGHNITKWDLPILEDRGFTSKNFVWDTLLMEILLNPCRYAYSLKTAHHAKDDVELTNRLFWSQLQRLASDPELCTILRSTLPTVILETLEYLRKPLFIDGFKKKYGDELSFFHEEDVVAVKLQEQLKAIESEVTGKPTLIIAPRHIWRGIAEYVPVSFLQTDIDIAYGTLSKEKLQEHPLPDPIKQEILLRFIANSTTPIVGNLASYLRLEVFDDQTLMGYITAEKEPIHCADPTILTSLNNLKSYEYIYFVGCELENRLNHFSLPTKLSATDFEPEASHIPMRLGGTNYAEVMRDELSYPLFADVPNDAANVWIERRKDGTYVINYNVNLYSKIKELYLRNEGKCKSIPWQSHEPQNEKIFLVHSKQHIGLDAIQKRVGSTSRYRSMYWMYQLALLQEVKLQAQLPVLYFVEDDSEIEEIIGYATSIGFYIPREGTLDRRLEKIAQERKGMLILPKEQFFVVMDKRLDKAYCYVWDQMAVEKHIMMWRNTYSKVSQLNDDVEEQGDDLHLGSTKDAYQSALLSLWPEYEYYHKFVQGKHTDSPMYILEPFLEDYYQLSKVWGTSVFVASNLWQSKEQFEEAIAGAEKFFHDTHVDCSSLSAHDIETAMEVIRTTLISVKGAEWSEAQKQVLPKILGKRTNYLVSMPTGGGKSVLFQGPALYNASRTNRLSIVITPLKALMQDQVKELAEKGFCTNVDYLNGDRSYSETKSIYRKVCSGELALLYVTPERFRSRSFLNALKTRMLHDQGLEYMIFDEAHCISQWGMEFRPEYLNVIRVCKGLSEQYASGFRVIMFSATVTDMIYRQINEVLSVERIGDDKSYNPIRDHIQIASCLVNPDVPDRLQEIIRYIEQHQVDFSISRMLVFCRTRAQCEEVAALLAEELAKAGIFDRKESPERVGFFHAGLDADDRENAYNRFKAKENPICILCATKAFGMGMDIPNIHYIVHLTPPTTLEDYLQEVGRAGRNKEMYLKAGFSEENPIPTVCLYSKQDIKKLRDLLVKSELSWPKLEEIRLEIKAYIEQIQPLEKTQKQPIVIPNNLWKKDDDDSNHTDLKIGMYWLEKLGRIEMGHLAPAHISLELNNVSREGLVFDLAQNSQERESLMTCLDLAASQQGSQTIQVSLNDLSAELSTPYAKLLNLLLECVKLQLIKIKQTVPCRVTKTRLDEVAYMIKNKTIHLALHIVIDAVEKLLSENKLNVERSYTIEEIQQFLDLSSLDNILIEENVEANPTTDHQKYMPWYSKARSLGLAKVQSYKDDLKKKRYRQIFTLLDIIPGVKCRSYIDKEDRVVKQALLIRRKKWKEFLPTFKADCLSVIESIYPNSGNPFNWSDLIVQLDLVNRGYNYFEGILRFLRGMAYIACDSLLPMGIEVFSTKHFENPIRDNIEDNMELDYRCFKEFLEASELRRLRIEFMDILTTQIRDKQSFKNLIDSYFGAGDAKDLLTVLGNYYPEDNQIWGAIRKLAIEDAEQKMKRNPEQWAIYTAASHMNVNVLAGPGSGKTHVLTMKCAKLIYKENVAPSQILVLAYNRAVVIELKTRLAKLFASLGLSRSASQLHVYTFHGLAKRVCGEQILDSEDIKSWERQLLKLIQANPMELKRLFPDIRYVLVDEFQDITQTRLDALFELKRIYPKISFFTIGDKDQSIYGFDKVESTDPDYYYKQLYDKLKPKQMTMFTNYRSYPEILRQAERFLPQGSLCPLPCAENIDREPLKNYAVVCEDRTRSWESAFPELIGYLKKKAVDDVAVFFRTNSEVYQGYTLIRQMNLSNNDVEVRVQGETLCGLHRTREIHSVLTDILEKKAVDAVLEFKNGEAKAFVQERVKLHMDNRPMWDRFYLDLVYTLMIDYLAFAESEEEAHTYGDMVESIRETLEDGDPQIYKIYDKYKDERILKEKRMCIILTTIHKVKGLEFDAVVVSPSSASLPYPKIDEDYGDLSNIEKEAIEEERRLLYVAFTRAKKFLVAYLGEREAAVSQMKRYAGAELQLGIREKEQKLGNYNLGFTTGKDARAIKEYISHQVKKNDPVLIVREGNGCYILSSDRRQKLGQLSQKSTIAQAMREQALTELQGFFISDIFCWTLEDTIQSDAKNGTNYAVQWCEEARGLAFVIAIAGYGKEG